MLDTTLTYIVSLSKEGESEYVEYPTECTLKLFGKNNVHCKATATQPGYRTKSFDCVFFEWMLYRGQARIKNSLTNRYNIWVGLFPETHCDPTQYTVIPECDFNSIIDRLVDQPIDVKENIRLLFNVPVDMLDYYITILFNRLVGWKNVNIFTHQRDNGIENISGWTKDNFNFKNISNGGYYFA